MIISFAWTVDAFLDGLKTATRRFWSDDYAAKFKPGQIVDAYNKLPRSGGKKIGGIKILRIYKQPLSEMTIEDFIKEGGFALWDGLDEFIELMGGPNKVPWVIEFEKIR